MTVSAGVKDVVPQVLDNGCYEGFDDFTLSSSFLPLANSMVTNPSYEGFEDLVDRANAWLKEQRGAGHVVITNMQSLMVVKDQGLYHSALAHHIAHRIPSVGHVTRTGDRVF